MVLAELHDLEWLHFSIDTVVSVQRSSEIMCCKDALLLARRLWNTERHRRALPTERTDADFFGLQDLGHVSGFLSTLQRRLPALRWSVVNKQGGHIAGPQEASLRRPTRFVLSPTEAPEFRCLDATIRYSREEVLQLAQCSASIEQLCGLPSDVAASEVGDFAARSSLRRSVS